MAQAKENKFVLFSKTIFGIFIAAIPVADSAAAAISHIVSSAAPVLPILPPQVQAIFGTVGLGIAAYGRFRANKDLTVVPQFLK